MFEYLGVIHYYMPPDYWNKEWHDEYDVLYGIALSKEDIFIKERMRQDRDEIALYFALKENIDEINEN